MKKIKQRAWDNLEKVMHYDFEFISSGDEENDWIIFKSDRQPLKDGKVLDNPHPRKRFEIMPSIGVSDRSGKLIYTFDIVVFRYYGDKILNENEWIYQNIGVDITESCGCCSVVCGYDIPRGIEDSEVFSNFYENRELYGKVAS